MTNPFTETSRATLIRRGFALEHTTLGWNVAGMNVAGIVVLTTAAISARSVALAGFGLDSLIEIGASTVGSGSSPAPVRNAGAAA